MKHKEVISQLRLLEVVKGIESSKVNYGIHKNLVRLKKEVEILGKQEQEILDIKKEFETKRIELCQRYSKVDDVVQTNPDKTFKIIKEQEAEFNAKVKDLQEEYKETLADFDIKHKEFLTFITETESSFTPYHIIFSDIPEKISTENMAAIFPFIKEE